MLRSCKGLSPDTVEYRPTAKIRHKTIHPAYQVDHFPGRGSLPLIRENGWQTLTVVRDCFCFLRIIPLWCGEHYYLLGDTTPPFLPVSNSSYLSALNRRLSSVRANSYNPTTCTIVALMERCHTRSAVKSHEGEITMCRTQEVSEEIGQQCKPCVRYAHIYTYVHQP